MLLPIVGIESNWGLIGWGGWVRTCCLSWALSLSLCACYLWDISTEAAAPVTGTPCRVKRSAVPPPPRAVHQRLSTLHNVYFTHIMSTLLTYCNVYSAHIISHIILTYSHIVNISCIMSILLTCLLYSNNVYFTHIMSTLFTEKFMCYSVFSHNVYSTHRMSSLLT